MRRLLYVVACMVVTVTGFALPGRAPAETRGVGLLKQGVEFTVKNPAENGATRQIVGYRYDTFCTSPTAVLLMHGLSYTKEAWDFPGYSVAQKLAAAGYAVFAIDRLGYGESKLENGYNVTHEAYADMAHQIVDQLRGQGFSHVVLGGHSAG
ncbi:MAG TPA: alpha/beta fold hydrolase, partial [Acidimicrobiia bacterium]|nr:alpha/beta fold hydrolase [Acidimicrobiia bacterium]